MESPPGPAQDFVLDPEGWRGVLRRTLYGMGKCFFRILFRVLWRARVFGLENVPPTGPLLLAANHASFVDPSLVGSSLRRPIYFMGKEELFRAPCFGWLLRQVNAFPIRRKEGDVGAFRLAQKILAAGGALIVFPEGKRQRQGVLGPPKRGVGVLAAKSRATVIPVYLHDTHRAWRLPRLAVVFGRPLAVHPGESGDDFAQRAMKAIHFLKEALRGNTP